MAARVCLMAVLAFVMMGGTSALSPGRLLAPADPDVKRTLCEMVTSRGYLCESHNVTTADDYVLEIFRVRNSTAGTSRGVVLLWHGLLDNAFTYIINEANESLAYVTADQGYDVWLGNTRGNIYGSTSTRLSPKTKEFWQFSWDETAKYDVPNVIDFVLGTTKQSSLGYVGHSQGTTQMFAGLSAGWVDPAKIDVYVALAPVAHVGHETNKIFRLLANPVILKEFLLLVGDKQFLHIEALEPIDELICKETPALCADLIELFCGPHAGAFNDSRMDVMASHEPGGTSVQNMVHWAQMVRDNGFHMFDYGKDNQKHYNSSTPPNYNLGAIPTSVPIALFTGSQDELADPTDVQVLLSALPTEPVLYKNFEAYAHLDFLWALSATNDIYKPYVLPLFSKYVKSTQKL